MKNKKKGFTLVELIVVLAILAILAALLVPALTGYIDKANSQKIVAECRQVVMAAQAEASSTYATITDGSTVASKMKTDAVDKLAEIPDSGKYEIVVENDGTVKSVKYTNSNWTINYSDGAYDTPKKGSTSPATAKSISAPGS